MHNMAKVRGKKTGAVVAVAAVADSITVQGQGAAALGRAGSHVALNARNNAELRANAQTILTMIQDA